MAEKNDPKCKECFDEGCKSCLDEMPECPTCNTNKYVDTIEVDQGVFCCVKCGTEFVESTDDDETDESALQAHWDRLASGLTERATTGSTKLEFGKVVDDTDPDNLREI